jgi:hypothetical protein
VNQRPKSPVREICTLGSVGAGGGQLPPATQWATSDDRPYRDRDVPRSLKAGDPGLDPDTWGRMSVSVRNYS